jgi:hypothetical protein
MGKRTAILWPWLVVVAGGCSGQDAEHLTRVYQRLGENLDAVTGGARGKLAGGWEAARASWHAPAVDGRVSARLRWDRNLAGAEIEVDSPSPGVIRLRGTVRDLDQRRRVVDLAGSTFEVEKVVDELTEAK